MEDSSTTDRDARAVPASCATRGTTTSASCCRRTCGGRSTTSPGLDNVRHLQGHLRRARRRSRSRSSTRCARATSACLEALVAQGAYVGIATHDEYLIGEALRIVGERGSRPTGTSSRCCSACGPTAPTSSSRRATGCACTSRTARTGTSTRVRRLQENPKIAGYVAARPRDAARFARLVAGRRRRRRLVDLLDDSPAACRIRRATRRSTYVASPAQVARAPRRPEQRGR